MPRETTDDVYNAAEPDWVCAHCDTHHRSDRDAAERCASAGPPDNRGPLAIFGTRLAVVTPSGAARFTHEVLYGGIASTKLTRPYPQVNLTTDRVARDPSDALYGSSISDVPLTEAAAARASSDTTYDSFARTARPRIRTARPRSTSDVAGWYGPIGTHGVDVLRAARSALVDIDNIEPAGSRPHHSRHPYPHFDADRAATSYSSDWPDGYSAVAEAVTASTHPATLNRWLHHNYEAVGEWIAAQYRIWSSGGDATIPAFHTFSGANTEHKPGLRRAAVLAPVAYPDRDWDRDALDEVRNDDRLGARAQEALLRSVATDTAPTIELPDLSTDTPTEDDN